MERTSNNSKKTLHLILDDTGSKIQKQCWPLEVGWRLHSPSMPPFPHKCQLWQWKEKKKKENHVLNSLTFGHTRRVSPLLHSLSSADVSPWESEVIVWLQGNSEKYIRAISHLFSALEGTFLPQLEKGLGCDWDEIDYGEFDLHVNVSRYLINGEAVEQVWAAHWSMTCLIKTCGL